MGCICATAEPPAAFSGEIKSTTMEHEFKYLDSLEQDKEHIQQNTDRLKKLKQIGGPPQLREFMGILDFAIQCRGRLNTRIKKENERFLRKLLDDLEKHLIHTRFLKEREIEEYKNSDEFQNTLRSLLRKHDVKITEKNEQPITPKQ